MEPDSTSVDLVKQKAKEKGINPKYPPGMEKAMRKAGITKGTLLDHKLTVLESGQTNINYKQDEIIKFLTVLDSKMSTIIGMLEDLGRGK